MPTLQERYQEILSKVVVKGDCWIYPTLRRAYLTVDGRQQLVYRIVYEACIGKIADGAYLLHSCDNESCCNPAHLTQGTQRENVLQAVERQRITSGSPIAGISWQATRRRWLVMPRVNGTKQCLYAGKDFFEAVCALKSFQVRAKPAGIIPE